MSEVNKLRDNLRFDVLRSAAYNGAREGWFGSWHKWIMGISLVAGTAAATTVLASAPKEFSIVSGFLVALLATIDLVFDLGGRARQHSNLRSRLFGLLADLECCRDNEIEILQVQRRLTRLYGEEPPTMRALDAIAYNQTAMTLGLDKESDCLVKVGFWETRLRHVWAFHNSRF